MEPDPKLIDEDEDDLPPVEEDEEPESAAPATEGAVATPDAPIEPEAVEPPPAMSQAQLEVFLNRVFAEDVPRAVEQTLQQRETAAQAEKTNEEKAREYADAVAQAEAGDSTALGELALKRILQEKARAPIVTEVRGELESEYRQRMGNAADGLIEELGLTAAAEAIKADPDLVAQLDPRRYPDLAVWTRALVRACRTKQVELDEPLVSEEAKAAQRRETSQKVAATGTRPAALTNGRAATATREDGGKSARSFVRESLVDEDELD